MLPLSLFKCRYGIRAGQTFLSLTRFIENSSNICISKEIYYEKIFNDLSNDANYVPQILIFSCIFGQS